MSENLGTPAQRGVRVQEDDEAVRRRGRGGVGRRPPREISRLLRRHFQQRGMERPPPGRTSV